MDRYMGEWLYCNFAAGSFHTKKLCSRFYSIEIEFYFKSKQGIYRHQSPPGYRNADREEPSHVHRGSAQKIRKDRYSGSRDTHTHTQTHRQTNKLIAILRSPTGAE